MLSEALSAVLGGCEGVPIEEEKAPCCIGTGICIDPIATGYTALAPCCIGVGICGCTTFGDCIIIGCIGLVGCMNCGSCIM